MTFKPGDRVVLVKGTYQGTPGVFLRLTENDPNWAFITEADGRVRNHPIVWLGLAPDARDTTNQSVPPLL